MNRQSQPVDAYTKRRIATRERLMAAAKTAMAETRVEAVAVDEIIKRAGVGKGSFYNHFKSKEDLFLATLDDIIADLTGVIKAAIQNVEDPAEVLAIGIKLHMELATADPEIGRFMINAPASVDMFKRYADPVVRRTVDKGVRSGRFNLQNRKVFVTILTSSVNATVLGLLEKRLGHGDVADLASSLLVLAGLNRDDAQEVVARPLPDVSFAARA